MFTFRHDSNPSVHPRKKRQGASRRYRFNEGQVWAKLPKTGQSVKTPWFGQANSGLVAFIDESEELKRKYTEVATSDHEEAEPILDLPRSMECDGGTPESSVPRSLPSSHRKVVEGNHFSGVSPANVTQASQFFDHGSTSVYSHSTPETSSIISPYGGAPSGDFFQGTVSSRLPEDPDEHHESHSPNLSHHSYSGSQPYISWPTLDHKEGNLLRHFIDNLSGWVSYFHLRRYSFRWKWLQNLLTRAFPRGVV